MRFCESLYCSILVRYFGTLQFSQNLMMIMVMTTMTMVKVTLYMKAYSVFVHPS